MSPLHFFLDLEPLTLIQDEFKIEVRQFAAAPDCAFSSCSYITRSPSISSSRSEGQASSFSFSAAYNTADAARDAPGGLHIQSAYADEIFLNGKIRPLHDHTLLYPVEAIALYADFPHSEAMQVQEGIHDAACTSSSPSLTYAPCTYPESPRAAPNLLYRRSEPAHVTLSLSAKPAGSSKVAYKRALSNFLPLRKVFHAEDECSSPSRKARLLKEPPHALVTKVSSLQSLFGRTAFRETNVQHLKKATTFVHNSTSIHAIHYNALTYNSHRASRENMSKRTSLPYRRGILACLGH